MRKDVGVDGDAQRISQLCWMFFLKILDDQDAQLELMESSYSSPLPDELRWVAWAENPEGMTGDDLLGFINGTLFPRLKEIVADGSWPRWFTRRGPTLVADVATAFSGTSVPFEDRTKSDERDEASRWSCGLTSRMTWYSFVAV